MKKILIIDDDTVFSKTLSDYLPQEKYTVVTATNGKEGLEKINSEKPDLVLLDMSMPEMNGIEMLKEINKEGLRVPILIASQVSQMEVISKGIEEGFEAGVKGYILKSSETPEMIVKTIEKTLATSE